MLCACVLSCFSRLQLFVTLWVVAHQLLCPWGFSRQEYWSGLSCPSPWDLPDPGIEPESSALQADSLPLSHREGPLCCVLQGSIMLLVNYISMKWEGGKKGGRKEGRRSRVACWRRGGGELGAASLGIQWTLGSSCCLALGRAGWGEPSRKELGGAGTEPGDCLLITASGQNDKDPYCVGWAGMCHLVPWKRF